MRKFRMVEFSPLRFETNLMNDLEHVVHYIKQEKLTRLVVINQTSNLIYSPKVKSIQASVNMISDVMRI